MRSSKPSASPDDEVEVSGSNRPSQQRASKAVRERSEPHVANPATVDTAATSSSSTLPSTQGAISEKAATQDAEDFFARAKAMGLNLTRQDYERARAGVSAFLRAPRVEKTDPSSGQGEGSGTVTGAHHSGSSQTDHLNSVSDRSPALPGSSTGSAKLPMQSRLSGRSASSPMLSFFTAVVPPEEDDAKPRPSLDDISALQERKRRRERRRRLREKLESRQISEKIGEEETASLHSKKHSLSSMVLEESPLTSVSSETPYGCSSSSISLTPSASVGRAALPSSNSLQGKVGLGLSMSDEVAKTAKTAELEVVESDQSVIPPNLKSPVQLTSKTLLSTESPGLKKLTQKAHIDFEGRLTLLSTPEQARHFEQCQEVEIIGGVATEEDELIATTNAGAETDDSGVFFTAEAPEKKDWSRRRRETSNDESPELGLDESLNRLSFLDRVMAQKRSPARLRREAKAREREARNTRGPHDIIVMTATASVPPPTSFAQSALQPPSRPVTERSEGDNRVEAKNVRWASDSASPRQRMTTKEHYDFAFYGIAPPDLDAMGLTLPTFEDEAEVNKRNGGEGGTGEDPSFHLRQRTTSTWMKSHLSHNASGSPYALRTSSSSFLTPHDSPGVLSLNFESLSDRAESIGGIHPLSAKRGLLFGPPSSDRTPPASMLATSLSGLDSNDAGQLFSQGPTLARSPARNVFDSYVASTPPPKLNRANTLAAPFTFQQQTGTSEARIKHSVEESPDRVMLMRAHSSGALERRRTSNTRQSPLPGGVQEGEGKENIPVDAAGRPRKVPAGWAHRSPLSKYETISPAAIFGMSTSQQRARVLSGEILDMSRLPLEPIKLQRSRADDIHTDEEGDDEREMDVSPGLTTSSGADRQSQRQGAKSLARHGLERHHTRDSSASTSVFGDSPLFLDVHNRTASVISNPTSSSTLSRALGMSTGDSQSNPSAQRINETDRSVTQKPSKKKKKKQSQQQQTSQMGNAVHTESCPAAIAPPASEQNPSIASSGSSSASALGKLEWDKPDGSRVIKLVSEELQAALESGSLTAEPPARYYKLPADWGRSKAKPQSVSYAGMIGQAILSSSDGRLSLNEIYNWISTVFPFFERGDRGWQNSIRHNLSLNKSFIKVEREANVPGKGGWWAIKEGHENRFQGGSYVAPGSALWQKLGAKKASQTQQSESGGDELGQSSQPMEELTALNANATGPRRKREESDRSEGNSEHPSDSDYRPSSGRIKPMKKSKKVKMVGENGKKTKLINSHPPALHGDTSGSVSVKVSAPSEAGRMPLRAIQSSSPRDALSDLITPHRSHHFTASSGHGSTSASSVMAAMPMLTDASSPPSSPNNFETLMPPPSGGVQGAASNQSAKKRKQAAALAHRATDNLGGIPQSMGMMYPSAMGFGGQTPMYASNGNTYGQISSHTLQASPLAHMRGTSGNGNGAAHSNSARLRAGPGHSLLSAMDSPLRRQSNGSISSSLDNSPSRLLVNSPISSLRGSAGDGSNEQTQPLSMDRSTAEGSEIQQDAGISASGDRIGITHSPQRGSPVRSGNAFAITQQQQYQPNNVFLSPAGVNMQMALGQGTQQQQTATTAGGTNSNGMAHFLNFGAGSTPTRFSDPSSGNLQYQRWGMSPSPSKPSRFTAGSGTFYNQNALSFPNPAHQSSGNDGMEDPFDYSGNLQHEFQMTAEMGQFEGGESPMKMGTYPQMARNQFSHNSVSATQQQQTHSFRTQQQSQLQHQPGFNHNGSYNLNFAAANLFGGQPYHNE